MAWTVNACPVFDPARLHRLAPLRYPHFVQSSASGGDDARYDIVFAFPEDSVVLHPNGQVKAGQQSVADAFLTSLDRVWSSEPLHTVSGPDFPFTGGWFVYLGYELAGEIEPTLDLLPSHNLPVAFATRVPVTGLVDRKKQTAFVVAEPGREPEAKQMLADIGACGDLSPAQLDGVISYLEEDPPEDFMQAVVKAKTYIHQGDVYQANLSRSWRGQLLDNVKPIELYQKLRVTNPAPFSGYLTWEDSVIVSSSPERLLRIQDGIAETRPIAGTRPRSGESAEDTRLSKELFEHPKERAEHIMLIDLERNDLGRICLPGTVEVSEMMVLESYARVHHIVSNVVGRLRDDVSPGQAIAAVFPGGTITGCPKVRCMEIIAELEKTAREAYTGSFGYLNHDGSMDLNILIRTFQIKGRGVSLRAGAGIVADSDPQAELHETRAKARAMIDAVESETGC